MSGSDWVDRGGSTRPLGSGESSAPVADGAPDLDATVIVVSFNTRELTLACLASVYRETRGLQFEVIVVDNASSDGSAEAIHDEFPVVRLHALDRNLGFGAANNLAASSARGEFIVLLNPDALVTNDAVGEIVRYARGRAAVGIVGGRTLREDGSLNPSSCWGAPSVWSVFCGAFFLSSVFPRSRFFNPIGLGRWKRDTEREVGVVSGCFLLLSRQLWRRLHGFDESFFMYGEDVDLSLRAAQLGPRPRITPSATVVHIGAASEHVKEEKLVRLMRSHRAIIKIHFSPLSRFLALSIHLAGMALRDLGARAIRLGNASVRYPNGAAWGKVWSRRDEWR